MTSRRQQRKTAIDRRLDDLDAKIVAEKSEREVQGATDDEEIQRLDERQDRLETAQADLRRRVERLEQKIPAGRRSRRPRRPGR